MSVQSKKERALMKHREVNQQLEQLNVELTYSVSFNLASVYTLNKMYDEALSAYNSVLKNKSV